jgi:plastocyanin
MRAAFPGVALLAAVLVLAGGCGGGGGTKKASGGGRTAEVSMKGLRFHPASMTVHVGQTIVWANDDSVDHNVTATSGGSFHSRAFGQGGTFRFTPSRAGTVRYVCTLHPGMTGSLTVVPGRA